MLARLTIERRLALIIALVAIIELWLAFQVPEPSTFLAVGPRLFPYILGGAMLLSAVLLFILPPARPAPAVPEAQAAEHTDATAVVAASEEGEAEALEWRRVLMLMALLLLYILAFEPLGFILSTAPFVFLAARILGSRNWLRDAIVAIGVAVGIFYIFNQLLKVSLPGLPF